MADLMNADSVVTGLDKETLARALGSEAWSRLASRWCDPDAFLGSHGGGADVAIWLYRSPAASLFSASRDAGDRILEDWKQSNRAALSLRPKLGNRLKFVNADVVDGVSMADALEGKGSPLVRRHPGGATLDAFQRIVQSVAPDAVEVFEVLQAMAWVVGDEARAVEMSAGTALLVIAAELQEGQRAVAAHEGNRLREQDEAAEARRLLLNEIEKLKTALAEHGERARKEEREALSRLHQAQEELEKYYLEAVAKQQEIERVRSAHEEAGEEVRALKLQLGYLQKELVLRSPPVEPRQRSSLARRVARRLGGMVRRTDPDPATAGRQRAIDAIRSSRWFDPDWYAVQYPDVAEAGMDPVVHYVDHGAAEGRDPGPEFSTSFYIEQNPDVAASGMNPLVHFIHHGLGEGRLPRSL